jgi:AAA15 family ATPase/GTPase
MLGAHRAPVGLPNMIREIQIENYKSIQKLKWEVGRFNVLIGENGCGKSNFLEAIALAAAAEARKLDNEFLSSRGIRVTDPKLMRSSFEEHYYVEPIKIKTRFNGDGVDETREYILKNDNGPYSKWTSQDDLHFINKLKNSSHIINITEDSIEVSISPLIDDISRMTAMEKLRRLSLELKISRMIKDFIIYSPENTALRNFYKEGQIEPLGINGEGLLKLLSVIKSQSATDTGSISKLDEIHQSLQLLDWYSDIEIPSDLSVSEDKVKIKDRYLTAAFDQRSANEGFLFILFYITLMVADETPKIFAIDNIDASLNPKLCTQLIKELIRLAEKYGKQVFVTGHNPAILDGIDLGDDEQRLLVLSRNKQGHTRCKRIELKDKPMSSTGEALKLSEAFLRGYLGGLPKGF